MMAPECRTDGVDLFQATGDVHYDLGVVGIGALNLDYIAGAATVTDVEMPSLLTRLKKLVLDATGSFELGTEKSVDEHTIRAALKEVHPAALNATLGGSAFNAIYSLTQMDLGIPLGFVGVAGRVPVAGLSNIDRLDELGVDRKFVRVDDSQTSGICFSFADGGERTLLTHNGANAGVANFIDQEFEALVDYLRSARVIHVTSFLDAETPARLLTLLTAVRRANPNVVISFDPGHEWAVGGGGTIDGIARLSDLLLLNQAEFRGLGRYLTGDDDHTVATRLLARLGGHGGPVVIVKRSDGVQFYWRESGAVRTERLDQVPLPAAQIEDSTGAGDVFAAGLLAAFASERLKIELGCALGMRMAKHALRHAGIGGHLALPEITREFIRGSAPTTGYTPR